MRALTALIKREFLEHRGAFVYAPAILLTIFSATMLFLAAISHVELDLPRDRIPTAAAIYELGIMTAFGAWSFYLLIALVFYYADSFSADRRNNALLFWKSMPQSDLKVLTSKALSGVTVFLALIFVFALLTSVVLYLVLLLSSTRQPFIAAPPLAEASWTFVQMAIVGALYLFLNVVWYAPWLAWIAGLSTLFRRWSIPLAILIPAVIVLIEYLNAIGGTGGARPIAAFLAWRLGGFGELDIDPLLLVGTESSPFDYMGLLLADTNWLHMALGLIFTAAIVFLASEYRRRRIEA